MNSSSLPPRRRSRPLSRLPARALSSAFLEFFAASIRNAHTRRAYAGAAAEFLAWCEERGVASITAIRPLHVAAYIDGCGLASDPKGALFWTIERGRAVLTKTPLPQANAYAMIGRRALAAGIGTRATFVVKNPMSRTFAGIYPEIHQGLQRPSQ